jgi:hypothetical protein
MAFWVLYERKSWGNEQQYLRQDFNQVRVALYRILCGERPD